MKTIASFILVLLLLAAATCEAITWHSVLACDVPTASLDQPPLPPRETPLETHLNKKDLLPGRFLPLPCGARALAATSEGVAVIGADVWHAGGYSGSGIRVAVFDRGFLGYSALISSGELPADAVIRSFRIDEDIEAGDVHGTACAEIIHDMAPGAQLYLVNFESDAEFGNAVEYAIAQGVQIVSCSMGWIDAGPFDGTGPVCDIVNHARDSGIFWAQTAGDVANKHWEGPWSDPDGDGVHNFTVGDDGQSITVSANRIIQASLVWDDPWGNSGNDYDFYLYDDNEQQVAGSEEIQDGDDYPVESVIHNVGPTGAGTYHLKIGKDLATSPANLELYSLMDVFEHRVAESSLVVPADAAGAIACGAVYWLTDGLEVFSSRGPANDGRLKPEFTAPDGVSTVSYPGGFYGASAAAAHLAGAATLVLEGYPGYSMTDVVTYLTQYAVDLGSSGWDNGHGYGRLSLGPVPNHPPQGSTVTPSSGSCNAGQIQQFVTTWQDADGWQDLKQCWFHIGSDASVVNSVTLMYNAVKDNLWLLNDDATAWTGGFALGSAHVLQNSQAKVYCWEINAYGTGDTLRVTWAIEFKPEFTGDKKLGLKCKDRHKARARGQWKGTWTIVESTGLGQGGSASKQLPCLNPA